MIHKTEIKRYNGLMDELIEDIGNLRYDSLANFLFKLSAKLEQDGINDLNNKRKELSAHLLYASSCLEDACDYVNDAWSICKDKIKK